MSCTLTSLVQGEPWHPHQGILHHNMSLRDDSTTGVQLLMESSTPMEATVGQLGSQHSRQSDPTTELWQQTPTSGEPPPGFQLASCFVIGQQLFHFGGHDGSNLYSTIHCLNMTDLSWSATTSTHTQGAPMRKFGSAMLEHANKLVLSGGYGVLPELSDPDKYVPDPDPEYEGKGYTNEVHCFHVDSSELY